ncbi:MAG: hypothetical protein QOJ65_147 [Fimbriimonadaceae bacterium]|jgi:predicted PurR-regulated permease PerM|nr:hypothetical protein [Fimbriimonadaceae bacterium]
MDSFVERYRVGAFAVLLLVFCVLGFAILLPFIPALLWATVLSILMYPMYKRIRRRLEGVRFLQKKGVAPTVASLITTLATILIIFVPFLLMGLTLYGQLSDFGHQIINQQADGKRLTLDSAMAQIDVLLKPLADRFGIRDLSLAQYVKEHRQDIGNTLRQPVGYALKTLGFTLGTMVVAVLTMFFMIRDGHRLRKPAHDLIPLPADKTDAILGRVGETVFAVFIGTVLVAIIQGTIMGAVYAWVGVPNPILLGFFSILLCIIPLLGAPVLYVPIALILWASGDPTGALKVAIVGFVIVSQIDNILKPIFIGGRANLHPLATFFSVLGGVMFFGPVGLMAGPMILTVLLALQDFLRERVASQSEIAAA